jgi:ParB family chromosome partitioning protein
MSKQRGLGKGLSSLFPTTPAPEETSEEPREKTSATTLPVASIEPNPFQPRRTIVPEQLQELASSIKEHGIIQPIVVRKTGDSYQIIAGERRWRAAQMLGLSEIPAREMELSDAQAMELALVENIQREDLSTLEIAQGIQDLISRLSLTHEEAAQKIGISRAAVTNKLRLLQLPAEVLSMLDSGALSEGHARALLPLPNDEKILELANLASQNGLTVRQLEDLVRRIPLAEKFEAAFPKRPSLPSEFEEEIALLNTNYNLDIKVAGNKKNMGLVIKGLKKWQIRLFLEYIEDHNQELFPRE